MAGQAQDDEREALRRELLRSSAALEAIKRAMRVPAECPVCATVAEPFLPFGSPTPAPDRKCPGCGSLERHRLIWLYFTERTNLFTDRLTMLHVAPEPWFGARLRAHGNLEYLSADLSSPSAMVHLDLQDIPLRDESVDVIYASHVLEHVDDDARAMRELYRVLASDGWAVLQVPIRGAITVEDPSVTDPAQRTRLFGQFDHVRMYGNDGEYEHRLSAAGFTVTVDRFAAELDPALVRRYRLRANEGIYYCTKSGSQAT